MPIEVERDAGIWTITINRPERRNALDLPHFQQLASAWMDFRDDDEARVAIVTGVANSFCVGADLKSFVPAVTEDVEGLATGVRTDIGVKVFGPDLPTIDRVSKEIEVALKPINGARDVVATPILGKGYLQIDINRSNAARYGVSVEDIKNTVEVALGGQAITQTVEGRERFPVRLRYPRARREDEEKVQNLLVGGSGMSRLALGPLRFLVWRGLSREHRVSAVWMNERPSSFSPEY